jgi:solute carrier family 25 protein 16
MSEISTPREGHADSVASKMDSIVKKAGSVVGGSKKVEQVPAAPDGVDTPATAKRKPPAKHSLDYMMRSGIAGGLAGCAVRLPQCPMPVNEEEWETRAEH